MAYETSSIAKFSLDKWLGESDMLVDEEDFVSQWRQDSGTLVSPVYFKLFTIKDLPEYAIMAIRGSETSYDWIVNMELWSSAGLSQTIKWLTPFGWIWTPILPDLIHAISFVESRAIRDVAYYKVTTRFVNEVLGGYGDTGIKKIYVTGASLGGGLAVITGAQTKAYTGTDVLVIIFHREVNFILSFSSCNFWIGSSAVKKNV
jgi:lipase ATG15